MKMEGVDYSIYGNHAETIRKIDELLEENRHNLEGLRRLLDDLRAERESDGEGA